MRLLVALTLMAMSCVVNAQSSGWRSLGEALGRASSDGQDSRSEQLRMQGAIQEAEFQRGIATARANQLAIQAAEAEAWWRDTLSKIWTAAGLPRDEAIHIASAFRLAPEQTPILDRAKREGVDTTIQAAYKAYREYNYQLANQLMVAAYIVKSGETQPK